MKSSKKIMELYDFDKSVLAGTTYRLNGSSVAPFESLNLGFNSGDDLSKVINNYSKLVDELDLKNKFLFLTNQVHATNIKVIRKEDIANKTISNNVKDMITFIDEHDGMLTNLNEVVLMTFYADCVPIVFFDPINNVIGNCHAGWRGTVKKIASVLIDTMINEFGSNASDILVAIGPCASKCCYEVDGKVLDEFINVFNNSDALYREKDNKKYMLDLKKANKIALLESGVDESNITISDKCTMCNNDLFFSYRAENAITGRHSAVITIK